MHHVFAPSGIDAFGQGILAGFEIGHIIVTPWIATFDGFERKPL